MQAGFAMLEAGIVQPKNATNILFKNIIDASLASWCFFFLGYGFAYGDDVGGGFIGSSNFALTGIYNGAGTEDGVVGDDGWVGFFFQWAFAGAAATIVAGSVCERTKIEAYFCYSIILTVFIYPVVVHWGWGSGFLSAWGAAEGPLFSKTEASNGMVDFAGSGVVHMVGGFSGLMGAIVVGPRAGRFAPDGTVHELYAGNKILQSLGTFILWFGWYGFNCGSTLMISDNAANVAGKVAVTSTLAAASGGICATFLSKLIVGNYDISLGLNGVLAGLVGITANCSVVNPWHAIIIGLIAAILLFAGHYGLLMAKIDDPCDACVVHGLCGCKFLLLGLKPVRLCTYFSRRLRAAARALFTGVGLTSACPFAVWGLLATGIFCIDENIQYAAYPNINEACKSGEQFGVQAVGGLAIIAWTCATAGATFVAVNATVGMRVSAEIEEAGLDLSEHGAVGDAWAPGAPPVKEDAMPPAEAGMVYLGGDQYGQA